jgi:protein arginine kinase
MRVVDISALPDQEKAALVDSHLTSVAHVVAGKHRFAIVDDHQTVSILINEEDHIRIQVILPGMQADAAWRKADALDDALSEELPIAYDDHLGYLTASVANCGMGLRISIMVHLPALALIDRLPSTWHAAKSLDAAVRGLYGEGTQMPGDIYQVSNAVSMGWTELQTVGKITAVATYLQAEETGARELLLKTRRSEMQNMVGAAQTRLREAERLPVEEGIKILSVLRMGHLMGIETHVTDRVFSELVAALRGGTQLIGAADDRARDVFYQETRRPALFRNRLRAEQTAALASG